MAVAGGLATNRIISHLAGDITDSTVTSTVGDVGVDAANLAQINAISLVAAISGANAVGVVLAFNTIGWRPTNFFFAALDTLLGDPLIADEAFDGTDAANTDATIDGSTVHAAGSVLVSAVNAAIIYSEVGNSATSAPAAMFGAAGMSVGAVISSSMVNSSATAEITDSTVAAGADDPAGDADLDEGADVSVIADDLAEIDARTTMYSEVSPTNDGGAGIFNQWASDVIDDYDATSNTGEVLIAFGARVRVADDYDHDDDGEVDDTAGSTYQYMGLDELTSVDLADQDYADYEYWKLIEPTTLISDSLGYAALGSVGIALDQAGITGGSESYFGLVDRNDVRSLVTARIEGSTVDADGDITVAATDNATITAFDDSYVSAWESKGAVVVTNLVLAAADALVTDSELTAGGGKDADPAPVDGGDISVTADMHALLDATASSTTETWDSYTAVVAFNTIGWEASNILFNAIEAFLGDPLISDEGFDGADPARAHAKVTDSTLDASGDILVTATSRSELVAVSSNDNTVDAVVDIVFPGAGQEADYDKKKNPDGKKASGYGASGAAGGAIVASNKVNSEAVAEIVVDDAGDRGTVDAGGGVTVHASDDATIDAHSTVVQDVAVENNIDGLVSIANDLLIDNGYDYTTASGSRLVLVGDRVRVGAAYTDLGTGGAGGDVYEFDLTNIDPLVLADIVANLGVLDLGAQTYDEAHGWKRIVADSTNLEDVFPGLGNYLDSDARAVGVLILFNDLRSDVDATIDHADVHAGGVVEVSALENALLKVEATMNVSASGGSFYGTGTVIAGGGQLVTNAVLADATALVDDSSVIAAGLIVDARSTVGIDARINTAVSTGDTGVALTLAFNTVGWLTQNVLFNAVDALLGDPLISDAFDGERPAASLAKVWDSTLVISGDVLVTADNGAQVNATITNAADSAASALFDATGKAGGGLLASNKVASSAEAIIGATDHDDDRTTREVDATGAVGVSATDSSGIYANIKLVTSSTTTNDGGLSVLQQSITGAIPSDFSTSEGERVLLFGNTVKIADDYDTEDFTTDDGVVEEITTGQKVRVTEGYAAPDFTSDDGIRLLFSGEVVEHAGVAYRYLGDNARLDLANSEQQYATSPDWAVVGGEDDTLYEFLGADATELDLGIEDYTATGRWRKIAGSPGEVYTYLGPDADGDGATIDLASADYGDLAYWKPNPATSILPSGINITSSDSMAIGAVVVLNDVRSTTRAAIEKVDVTADSVAVTARSTAVIRAHVDTDVTSSGGQSWGGEGDSLAVGAVIATNVIESSVVAEITDSDIVTAGDVVVSADGVSQIDATTLNSIQSEGDTYGVTLAFNTIGWESQNFLFNAVDTILGDPLVSEAFGNGQSPAEVVARIVDSTVHVGGDVEVAAVNAGVVQAEVSNVSSSVVVTFTQAEAFALGFVVASNMVNVSTRAEILYGDVISGYAPTDLPDALEPGDLVILAPGVVYEYVGEPRGPPSGATSIDLTDDAQGYATSADWARYHVVDAGGSVIVTADEVAAIDADSDIEVTATADSTVGMNLVLDLLTSLSEDYQYTDCSGTRTVLPGEAVLFTDTCGSSSGEAGRVYIAVTGGDIDLGDQTFDGAGWLPVVLDDALSALSDLGISTTGILGADATGVGGMFVRNDVRGDVEATVEATVVDASVGAGTDVRVAATESAAIRAESTGTVTVGGGGYVGEGSSTAVNFVVATNLVLSGAVATVDSTDVVAGGDITVAAANDSLVDAITETETNSAGTSVGVTIAFNSIGIDSQNILFNILEAIVGDVIDTEAEVPARTEAIVTGSDLDAGGDISVTATSTAIISSEVRASTIAFGSSLTDDSTAISVGVVVSMNRLATTVTAILEDASSVQAGGGVLVSTGNTVGIFSQVTAPSISIALSASSKATSASIGVSISRNDIDTAMNARIDGVADLDAENGDVVVSATQGATISASSIATAISVSASVGGKSMSLAGGGASAINLLGGTADAEIIDSTVTARGAAPHGRIDVAATQTTVIDAVIAAAAVSIGVSGSASATGIAIGLSVARNLIGWEEYGDDDPATVRARTENSILDAQRGISIIASSPTATVNAKVLAAAVSFTASPSGTGVSVSAGGLYTENKIAVKVVAEIAGATSVSTGSGGVTVTADDHTTIISDSAAAAMSAALSGTSSSFSVAVGAAVAYNRVKNQITARIADVDSLTTGGSGVTVTATDRATIQALTVAVAVGLTASTSTSVAVSGGGAIAFNSILTATNASIERSTLGSDADGDGTEETGDEYVGAVVVDASSTSTIDAVVAAVSVQAAFGNTAVGVAIGAAVALNLIGFSLAGDPAVDVEDAEDAAGFDIGTPGVSEVRARIVDSTIWSDGALKLEATAAQSIRAFIAAAAVGVAGGSNGVSVSAAGAFSGNRTGTNVEASISDPTATGAARDSITVASAQIGAGSDSGIQAFAGAAAIAGAVGSTAGVAISVGLGIAWNEVGDAVLAAADDVALDATAGTVSVEASTAGRPVIDPDTDKALLLTGITADELDDLASREDGQLEAFLVERFENLDLLTTSGTNEFDSITKTSGRWTLTFGKEGSSTGSRSFLVRVVGVELLITPTDAALNSAPALRHGHRDAAHLPGEHAQHDRRRPPDRCVRRRRPACRRRGSAIRRHRRLGRHLRLPLERHRCPVRWERSSAVRRDQQERRALHPAADRAPGHHGRRARRPPRRCRDRDRERSAPAVRRPDTGDRAAGGARLQLGPLGVRPPARPALAGRPADRRRRRLRRRRRRRLVRRRAAGDLHPDLLRRQGRERVPGQPRHHRRDRRCSVDRRILRRHRRRVGRRRRRSGPERDHHHHDRPRRGCLGVGDRRRRRQRRQHEHDQRADRGALGGHRCRRHGRRRRLDRRLGRPQPGRQHPRQRRRR